MGKAFKKPPSGVRDPENRSNKNCVCGGHNANNHKKNLDHHSTLSKNEIRILRRFKDNMKITDIPPEFAKIVDEHFWELI